VTVWSKRNIIYLEAGVLLIFINIFIIILKDKEKKAKVIAIIDWQNLTYYQKWEIASAPRILWSYVMYN
jgi:hypothetical protein